MKAMRFLAGLAAFALVAVSCATDVGDIDRTQHDKLEKKLFAGIWYMNQTVVDIPYNATFSFVGEMNFGNTGKVIFDIQEKMLVVYPATEYVEGAEAKWHAEQIFKYWDDRCTTRGSENFQCVDGVDNLGQPDKTCCFVKLFVGQPLAAYEITSHFDVVRKYNAATGEQSNVIEENTTDKYWWQRTHVRVNWAKSLINDFTFMASKVTQTPVDYYVQTFEEGNPDAPTLTPDYIDVVTKFYGEPASAGTCDIYAVSTGDCAPAVVKARTAFRKVDVAQDYESKIFTNATHMKWFGYFLTERYAYDPALGYTESGRVSFINRWNLWQHSFDEADIPWIKDGQPVTNADGTPAMKPCFKDMGDTGCDTTNRDGAKEFCKADDWFTQGRCVTRTTRPFTQRGLKPIVYHVSYNLPDEFWAGSIRTAQSWSDTVRETVAWLYFWEEKNAVAGQPGIFGQYSTRACETDADCAPDAILDTWVEVDSVKPPTASTKPAKTLFVGPNAPNGITVVDWSVPDGLASKAGVRFVNLGTHPCSLVIGGNAVVTDADPLTGSVEDAGAPAHALVDPFAGQTVEVKDASGAVVATLDGTADGVKNTVTTFVHYGTKVYKSTVAKSSIKGLRVMNLTDVALDVSIDGGLRAANLQPGENSGYQTIGGGSKGSKLPADYVAQRVVAMPAGAHGDVTCFRYEQNGVCVGYRPQVGDADWTRYEEIKASLPEMFTICRNTYTAATETAKNDDVYASALYAPWTEVKKRLDAGAKVEGGKLGDLPVLNPCLDFQVGADRLTPEERVTEFSKMKKIGDSRYSMIYWISEAEMVSPLGYGPSAADPDTGEIFWATANIYGWGIYYYGAMYRDMFDLINGKLDTTGLITGKYVKNAVLGHGTGSTSSALVPDSPATVASDAHPDLTQIRQPSGLITSRDILAVLRDRTLPEKLPAGLPGVSPSFGRDRLAAIKGTPYEALLANSEMQLAAATMSKDASASTSPLDWATLEALYKKERERQIFLSSHNYCFADYNDEGVIGGAKAWGCMPKDSDPSLPECCVPRDPSDTACTFDPMGTNDNCRRPKCPADLDPLDHDNDFGLLCCVDDGEQLAKMIAQRFYVAVVEHEVGHTVGLRHNFEGSSDAFNFPDRYFDVREKERVPCVDDYECERAVGEVCKKDPADNKSYCALESITACTKASDCGSPAEFDCVTGQCVALKRCGVHGECPSGAYCVGDTKVCHSLADKTRLETPVVKQGDGFVRQFIPRGELTASESLRNRTRYQVSTIMDYGQRWNSDIDDLGKYDYAAIRFGYGGLMDVYTNVERIHKNIRDYAVLYGDPEEYTSDAMESSYWNWGISYSQFYFLQNNIGVEANRSEGAYKRNRLPVPFEWVMLEHSMNSGYYRQILDWTYVIVPYKFCGDEYAGNVGCYTWDTGIDPLEIVHNMEIELKDYYLFDAFKRERYGFGLMGNPMSYLSRITSRWMEPMRGAGMYYALFTHILKNYGDYRRIWANGRMFGWGLRRAAETGFETLANSLASPAPGSFALDAATGAYRNISFDPVAGADLVVPVGTGKFPYTTFMNDAGQYYWYHAQYIGSFWEKLGALMTLTDSTVYFTSNYVGEQLNIGVGTSIGFNTLYPKQLVEVIGGLVAGDDTKFSWTYDDATKTAKPHVFLDPDNLSAYTLSPPPYLTASGASAGKPVVEPSIENMTLKLYTMLYGMAYLPASFDPSFLDSFALCMKGNGNCHDVSAAFTVKEFTDPFGGLTYVAWQPLYTTDWYSPNVSLIDKANALATQWQSVTGDAKAKAEVDLRKVIDTLDLMKGIYEVFNSMKI
jgi:hypothetical protein